jgi:hypothetical protein
MCYNIVNLLHNFVVTHYNCFLSYCFVSSPSTTHFIFLNGPLFLFLNCSYKGYIPGSIRKYEIEEHFSITYTIYAFFVSNIPLYTIINSPPDTTLFNPSTTILSFLSLIVRTGSLFLLSRCDSFHS